MRFRRQTPIGPYIADFYCPTAKLIIEIDGPIHSGDHAHLEFDRRRDDYFERHGIRSLRFTNRQVVYRTEEILYKIGLHITDLI